MNDLRSALIVDDERDIRELLVLTLGRMGLRTETASSLPKPAPNWPRTATTCASPTCACPTARAST
jgi:CheY-like chemotaxis protein